MPADHEEDQRLIDRVRAGDLSALGALFDKHRLLVFHTALAITRDRPAAEDILQECFLRLNAHAARLDGALPLAPWLYRVTVNLSYTWLTRDARRQISLEGLLDHLDRLVAPVRTAPEHQVEAHDVRESIQHAVEGLPFHQRVVVILHYLSGLDLKEIAYILDCPVGTVKSRLHHGREALRVRLAGSLEPQTVLALEVAYDCT